jgi:hypothetical protein
MAVFRFFVVAVTIYVLVGCSANGGHEGWMDEQVLAGPYGEPPWKDQRDRPGVARYCNEDNDCCNEGRNCEDGVCCAATRGGVNYGRCVTRQLTPCSGKVCSTEEICGIYWHQAWYGGWLKCPPDTCCVSYSSGFFHPKNSNYVDSCRGPKTEEEFQACCRGGENCETAFNNALISGLVCLGRACPEAIDVKQQCCGQHHAMCGGTCNTWNCQAFPP